MIEETVLSHEDLYESRFKHIYAILYMALKKESIEEKNCLINRAMGVCCVQEKIKYE